MTLDVVAVGSFCGAVLAITGLVMLFHRLITRDVRADLEQIRSELRSNGGSSLRDQVDKIRNGQESLHRDITELKGEARDLWSRVDGHVQWHLDNQKEK